MANLQIESASREFVGRQVSFPQQSAVSEQIQKSAEQAESTIHKAAELMMAIQRQRQLQATADGLSKYRRIEAAINEHAATLPIKDRDAYYSETVSKLTDEILKEFDMTPEGQARLVDLSVGQQKRFHFATIGLERKQQFTDLQSTLKDLAQRSGTARTQADRDELGQEAHRAIFGAQSNNMFGPDTAQWLENNFVHQMNVARFQNLINTAMNGGMDGERAKQQLFSLRPGNPGSTVGMDGPTDKGILLGGKDLNPGLVQLLQHENQLYYQTGAKVKANNDEAFYQISTHPNDTAVWNKYSRFLTDSQKKDLLESFNPEPQYVEKWQNIAKRSGDPFELEHNYELWGREKGFHNTNDNGQIASTFAFYKGRLSDERHADIKAKTRSIVNHIKSTFGIIANPKLGIADFGGYTDYFNELEDYMTDEMEHTDKTKWNEIAQKYTAMANQQIPQFRIQHKKLFPKWLGISGAEDPSKDVGFVAPPRAGATSPDAAPTGSVAARGREGLPTGRKGGPPSRIGETYLEKDVPAPSTEYPNAYVDNPLYPLHEERVPEAAPAAVPAPAPAATPGDAFELKPSGSR